MDELVGDQRTVTVTIPCRYRKKDDGKDSTVFHFDQCDLCVSGRFRYRIWDRFFRARDRHCEKMRIVLEFDPHVRKEKKDGEEKRGHDGQD